MHIAASPDRPVRLRGRCPAGRQGRRAARLRAAGGGQARERPLAHRRGQAAQVDGGGRPAQAAARQPGQVRRQDDRGAAHRAVGHHGRERGDPPLRPLRGRGLAARGGARLRADPAQALGRGAHGGAGLRHRPRARGGDRPPDQGRARPRRGDRGRAGRGEHLPRDEGGGRRHGPGDGRLHGHAGHRAERAHAAGRARAPRRAHARAERDHDLRGGRALHPAPRDAPPREGPRRHLRGGHRQPVLHHGHRGGPAGARDPRRGDPDGQERCRGRVHRRSPAGPRRDVPARPSRTARRSSAASV